MADHQQLVQQLLAAIRSPDRPVSDVQYKFVERVAELLASSDPAAKKQLMRLAFKLGVAALQRHSQVCAPASIQPSSVATAIVHVV